MLTILGKKQKFCDGISRRNFMKIGAFGAGLTLADMLRLRAAANGSTSPQPADCESVPSCVASAAAGCNVTVPVAALAMIGTAVSL